MTKPPPDSQEGEINAAYQRNNQGYPNTDFRAGYLAGQQHERERIWQALTLAGGYVETREELSAIIFEGQER